MDELDYRIRLREQELKTEEWKAKYEDVIKKTQDLTDQIEILNDKAFYWSSVGVRDICKALLRDLRKIK